MVKIEAVTCCVNYCDFLQEVEPFVRPLVDRWLIVTTPQDDATRDLCRRRGMECLVTDDFHREGAKFDKAMGIDRGLQQLSYDGWVLVMDADIVIPPHFRESVVDAHLDPECIYGCDRFEVVGWDRWQALKGSGFFDKYSRNAHHNVCFPAGFDVGARWADTVQGYVPIGFFQLFSAKASVWRGIRHKRYPTYGHSDAARTDVQHGLQWDRRKRVLLPEVVVAHLQSEKSQVGANWGGRTTPRFGPLQATLVEHPVS